MSTDTPSTDSQQHSVENNEYDFTLPPDLAEKLVRLLNKAEDADSLKNALYLDGQSRKDIGEMRERLVSQLREQS